MSTNTHSYHIGPGFLGCLTLIFVAAKLTGHIAWSWWWVLAPLWVPWAVLVVVVLAFWVVVELGTRRGRK